MKKMEMMKELILLYKQYKMFDKADALRMELLKELENELGIKND